MKAGGVSGVGVSCSLPFPCQNRPEQDHAGESQYAKTQARLLRDWINAREPLRQEEGREAETDRQIGREEYERDLDHRVRH